MMLLIAASAKRRNARRWSRVKIERETSARIPVPGDAVALTRGGYQTLRECGP
ncbi:MAG: hypothetical protein IID31_12715 [Planctomycetes bacterium]|nr:hypothetical protein [Planctomycetota bacterium]